MKMSAWRILDHTIGRFVRVMQAMKYNPPSPSVQHILNLKSIDATADWIAKNAANSFYFKRRQDLFDYVLFQLVEKPLIMEFGVYKGNSINYFAKKRPDAVIYGFDSFSGLSENWPSMGYQQGHFNLNGVLPKVEKNVNLIKGFFEVTLNTLVRAK